MNLTAHLRTHRLLAIVRGRDPEAALNCVLTLAKCGIPLIEVSLTTTDAAAVIDAAARELGDDVMIGAGTAMTSTDVGRAVEAGASYIVTPGITEGLREALRLGVPTVAGALTPTEVAQVLADGVDAVKLFPASLGGPSYLRALVDPFPAAAFVPVGGITAEAAPEFLAAGATAVGVGSPLVGDAADGGNLELLAERARLLMNSVSRP